MDKRYLNSNTSPERRALRDQIRTGSQGDHRGESSQDNAGQKKITNFTRHYFENQYCHHEAADQPGVQQIQASGEERVRPFHQHEPWSATLSEQASSEARNLAIEQINRYPVYLPEFQAFLLDTYIEHVHRYPVYVPKFQAFYHYPIGGGDPSWPYAFQDPRDQHNRLFFTQQQDDPRYPLGQFYRLSREENKQDLIRLPTAEQLVFLEQQGQWQAPTVLAEPSRFEANRSRTQAPSEASHQTPRGFISDAPQEPLQRAKGCHLSSDTALHASQRGYTTQDLPKQPLTDISHADPDLATQYFTFSVSDLLSNPQQHPALDPYKTSISSWGDLLSDLDMQHLLSNRPSQHARAKEDMLQLPQEEACSFSDYLVDPSSASDSELGHHCQSFPDDGGRKRKHDEESSSSAQAAGTKGEEKLASTS